MNFKILYNNKIKKIDDYISEYISSYKKASPILVDAMKYSVLNGGKRLRSILCTEICSMLGGDVDKAMPFACGIELIHAYSLVHDDLPAMDNDDYRRGQLSCLKKYGEAMGILCGDALLNAAFELMFNNCNDPASLEAARVLAASAGADGMISGQVNDLGTGSDAICTETQLIKIIEQKTMAIIKSAVVAGALLAKADSNTIEEMGVFAYHLGLAFQIRDDFEDIAEDASAQNDSPNFINALGEEVARNKLKYHSDKCKEIILKYADKSFVMDLLEYLF